MKITKKLEAEIKVLMDDYWDSYFRGDLKHWRNYLVDDYRNIGGTEEEIWNSRKEILDYTRRIIDQITGLSEIRNKKTQIIPYDPYIMVHEFMDLFIKVEGKWTFYGKFRLSSLIQKTAGVWKVLHQHGSYPDSHTEQGEAFAFDKLRKENTQLREAVKRRTIELENKNRELEIETALEKVRAVALGMKKPEDMLIICETISKQLEALGVKEIRNIQTGIIYVEKGSYMNYQYYAKHDKTFITDTVYTNHPVAKRFVAKMLKGKGQLSVSHIKGKQKLKEWIAYQKGTNVFIDKYLNTASSLHYYWYSLGPVALGISTYQELTKDEWTLFQRFLNVFELAYRRYLDIEKAEAQAKEARVEASLEKVRAQAMGMRKPEDLLNICETLYKELRSLGFTELRNAMINIHNDEKKTFVNYDYSNKMGRSINPLTYNIHPVIEKQIKQIRKANDAFSETVFEGNDLASWKKFRKKVGEKDDPRIKNCKALYYYFYSIGNGSIGISTFSPVKDEMLELLKRFRNVFALSYQRYTDIAFAEMQAREAKIETALERVRAAAMAMHKLSDLSAIGKTIFSELKILDFTSIRNTEIVINNDEKETVKSYHYSDYGKEEVIEIDYKSNPIVKKWAKDLRKTDHAFVPVSIPEKQMKTWDKYRKELGYKPDPRMAQAKEMHYCSYSTGHGALSISTWQTLDEEKIKILERFRNVFKLSYQRYIDIAKAEAQAREAQIQLAMERVRARTMAMQKSNELPEAANLLFLQVQALGMPAWSAGYCIWDDDKKAITLSMSSEGLLQPSLRMPLTEDPSLIHFLQAHQRGDSFFVEEVGGEALKSHYVYLRTLPGVKETLDDIEKAGFPVPAFQIFHCAYFSKGFLLFITYESVPEAHDIFRRFAKVFEQTYTRFLDLQKAEEQAREALIEAALERVRSRSMAMHSSNELTEVSALLYKELQGLGVTQFLNCGYVEIDELNRIQNAWMTNADGLGFNVVQLPLTGDPVFDDRYEAWKRKEMLFQQVVGGDVLKNHIEVGTQHYRKTDIDEMVRTRFPDPTIFYCGNFKFGYLNIITGTLLTKDQESLLIRFTKVFEMTYGRFLDLQKAEAQAREAKIEAALERTRTQSMLMQHSNELDNTLRVFHEQVLLLGIHSAFSFLWLPDENKDRHIFWAAWAENNSTVFQSKAINYPLDRNEPATAQCLVDWKGKEPVVSYHVPPAGVENYFAAWQELIAGAEQLKPEYFSDGLYYVEAFMKYGCFGVMVKSELPEEEKKILYRFAIEFERAYTRFLDLQKAEAQAREAQIEAALERVRSRSMAMHKSDELLDIINVVSEQLQQLKIKFDFVSFGFITQDHGFDFWLASPLFPYPEKLHAPQLIDNPIPNTVLEAQKKGVNFFTNTFSKEENNQWLQLLIENNKTSQFFRKTKDFLFNSPGFARSAVLLKNINVFIGNYIPKPYSDEQNEIIKRFANVFEQSYTRFIDLKKSEAQTREALIEGALERVRARALAMQQPEELKDVAQVMRNEMGALGVEELETSSIYIHGDSSENVECWYALQDPKHEEKKMVADHFILNLDDTWVGREMKKFYLSGEKQTSVVMQGANRKEWIKYCYEHSPVFSGFYGETIPDRTYHLYKFSHGYIGAAAPGDISAESWRLLSRAASVFSLAYSRFRDLTQARNDLIKLKEEKKRAEDALTELQATQKQLVQSEKMASLGELTAGIAHEIQNPLNFVNNFSDVSNELLEEMKTELEKGNKEDAIAIVADVKQNLEKILHHGKRADAIVKGMLQHSRSSSGVKEPTDINALADEYLRLAYHGLRAKDKTFNATMKTDFDETIGNINIIPQDMGRVILNLINNAFYVVDEKKKQIGDGYEPTVSVSTKKAGNKVLISVKDNGNGIPQKVLDKIFQPFFTTKPTGQGTGLGLSLSYDIITKGHSGEIKVITKENEGTEFIILLPEYY